MINLKAFFWPDGETEDYYETSCKRLLIFFSVFAFITSVFVTTRYIAQNTDPIPFHASLALYSYFLFLLVPVALYKGMPLRLAAYLTVGYTFFRLVSVAFVMGGLASSQILFFIPTVLLLTFVCGNRAGFIATVIAIGFLTSLAIGAHHSVNPQHLPIMWNRYLGVTVSLMMVYTIGAISRHQIGVSMTGYIRARSKAQKASQAKSEFLSNMSHEIRTPLNGVIGIAQAMRYTELTEKQTKMLDIMERSGDALLKIIGDILDFSKIEAGKVQLESQAFNPRVVVGEVAEALVNLAHEKELKLFVDGDANLPETVYGDSNRYRQILYNFVSNAIKFTHKGEIAIKLSGTVTGEFLQLETRVTDTGIGVAPEMTKAIFENFTQADSSTTRVYGGTGLGLSICGGIAELMGGKIGVDSKPGQGSSFWCNIPFPLEAPVEKLTEDAKLSA